MTLDPTTLAGERRRFSTPLLLHLPNGVGIPLASPFSELSDCPAHDRVDPLRHELGRRNEREGPFRKVRMGQHETGSTADQPLHHQQVDVQRTWTPPLGRSSLAAGSVFEGQTLFEKSDSCAVDLEEQSHVEEPGLRWPDRTRAVQRRGGEQPMPLRELGTRHLERCRRIADVSPQAQHDLHPHTLQISNCRMQIDSRPPARALGQWRSRAVER